MDNIELLAIADAWIEYHHAGELADEHNKNFWAYEKLSELTRNDPEIAWKLIIMIFQRDPCEAILANLAAGPLEDMLGEHGANFIQRIEDLAHEDVLFRKMLGCIWKNQISDSVWMRLKALNGEVQG